MRKADITLRREHRRAIPVVSVKHYGPPDFHAPNLLAWVLEANPGIESPDLPFLEWLRARATIEQRDAAYQWAISDGWDELQERAIEIYGPDVRVVSHGRSGGWASITLEDGDHRYVPDVDRWDAIDCDRWGRFVREAGLIVGDLDYQYLTNLLINMYAAEIEGMREARAHDRRCEVLREHAIAACVDA